MAYISDSETDTDSGHPTVQTPMPRHPPTRYPSPQTLPTRYPSPNPPSFQHTSPKTSSPNIYTNLPIPDSKYAPKTFSGEQYELEPFLEAFNRICLRHNITTSREQYLGLLQYCTPKMAQSIRSYPSHASLEYPVLVDELKYFYGTRKVYFNKKEVNEFIEKWTRRPMVNFDRFLRYHRKYYELLGEARAQHLVSRRDYDGYFWEGLPKAFRKKVEYHMLATNHHLSNSSPFRMKEIVKAAQYILSPERFDKHLHQEDHQEGTLYSESDQEVHTRRRKHVRETSSESESEAEVRPLSKPKTLRTIPHLSRKSKTKKPSAQGVKKVAKEDDDISELARRLADISLSGPDYTALYVEIVSMDPTFKDAFETPRNREARLSQKQTSPPSRPPLPPQPYQPSGFGPGRGEIFCYGCGKRGHHVRECEELNSMLQKGVIIRDSYGRLKWADGSRISRRENETWMQAITSTKQANLVRINGQYDDPNSVYNYLGVAREEDDACTEDQEELGWTSGEVRNSQAYSAERGEKGNRDHRIRIQNNPPSIPQRVVKLPQGANSHKPSRPRIPIQKNIHPNTNQAGPPKRPVPVDIHQNEFKGKGDDQFLLSRCDVF